MNHNPYAEKRKAFINTLRNVPKTRLNSGNLTTNLAEGHKSADHSPAIGSNSTLSNIRAKSRQKDAKRLTDIKWNNMNSKMNEVIDMRRKLKITHNAVLLLVIFIFHFHIV